MLWYSVKEYRETEQWTEPGEGYLQIERRVKASVTGRWPVIRAYGLKKTIQLAGGHS